MRIGDAAMINQSYLVLSIYQCITTTRLARQSLPFRRSKLDKDTRWMANWPVVLATSGSGIVKLRLLDVPFDILDLATHAC